MSELKLKSIRAQNYGPIKDITLDLQHVGVTVIRGRNLDASSGANYTNAAGKSLLVSVLPEMMFGSPPSGKDSTKHEAEKIKGKGKGKGANATVLTQVWEHKGAEYKFDKHYGGRGAGSKRFEIFKDGKTLNNRTLSWAQDRLKSLVGGTEEDFYSQRFIDSTIPHPLIVGSAAVRQDYLVKLFDLQNVDAIRKVLLVELRDVQKAGAAYREIKSLFDSQKEKAGSLKDVDENKEQLEALCVKQKRLLSQLNAQQIVRSLLQFEEQNEKLLRRFNRLTTTGSFETDYKRVKTDARLLSDKLELAQEWADYSVELKQWNKRKEKTQQDLKDLGLEGYSDKKIYARWEKYNKANEDIAVAKSELKALEKEVAEIDLPEDAPSEPKRSAKECDRRVASLSEELEHISKFHKGKCPTCGSRVEARTAADVKDDLKQWRGRYEKAQAFERYTVDKQLHDKKTKAIKVLRESVKELTVLADKAETYSKALYVLERIADKPEKPEGAKVDAAQIREELEATNLRLLHFRQFKDVIETIEKLNSVSAKERTEATATEDLADKVQRLNVKISELSARTIAQDEAIKTLKDLSAKGKELQEKARDEKVIKALIEAYSKKGLKKALIESYAKRLEQQLNKMARLFFAEDMVFEFRYGSAVEFLVYRNKKAPTDVRRLSGAEKRMLTLALVASSIMLLPVAKRPNELILDEPEANLGPDAVETFVKVLPVLNKIVPHIVVVTPRPDLEIPGARILTVIKHRGISTLSENPDVTALAIKASLAAAKATRPIPRPTSKKGK